MAMLFKAGQWVINLNNVIAIDTEYSETTIHYDFQNSAKQETKKRGVILYFSVPSVTVNNPAIVSGKPEHEAESGFAPSKQKSGFGDDERLAPAPSCPKMLKFFDQEAEAIRTWLAKYIPDVMSEST